MKTRDENKKNDGIIMDLIKIAESYKTSSREQDYENQALKMIKESNYPKKEILIDYWVGLTKKS